MINGDRSKLSLSLTKLRAAKNNRRLEKAFRDIRDIYGFKHLAFLWLRTPHIGDAHHIYCTTYPQEWTNLYIRKNYFSVDPVIQLSKTGFMPVDWSSLDRRPEGIKQLFIQANAAGVGHHGLTVPIRGPRGERSILSVTSDRKPRQWRYLSNGSRHDLMVLSHFVHERTAELYRLRLRQYKNLSNREQQCLELLARGIVPKRIASILNLSESAVRLYLSIARRKLHAATLYQAIALASVLELIDV